MSDNAVVAGPNASPMSFSFSAQRFFRLLRCALLSFSMVLAPAVVPRLWGCHFGWTGPSEQSWSMANEGGIMPLSITYHRQQSAYVTGDVVHFEDPDPDTGKQEWAIKSILAENDEGYLVGGLNEANSDPSWVVPRSAVRGRVVYHYSPVPVFFWRWLSMGWSLNHEEIAERSAMIFSARFLWGFLSGDDRYAAGGPILSSNPQRMSWGESGKYLAIFDKESCQIKLYSGSGLIAKYPSRSMGGFEGEIFHFALQITDGGNYRKEALAEAPEFELQVEDDEKDPPPAPQGYEVSSYHEFYFWPEGDWIVVSAPEGSFLWLETPAPLAVNGKTVSGYGLIPLAGSVKIAVPEEEVFAMKCCGGDGDYPRVTATLYAPR